MWRRVSNSPAFRLKYKGMKFFVDLHVHSWYSGDSDADPEEYIQRAIELNLHGIAFTEHYSFAASEPVEALIEKYGHRIMVFRGVELSAAEGHCLVFGADTDALHLNSAPLAEVVDAVSRAGGVVIPSHPYRAGHGMGDAVLETGGLCALEGYNGYNMWSFNERAVEAARLLNIPFTGGSDAHAPAEIGYCITEFQYEVRQDDLVAALKGGKYRGIDRRRVSRGMDMYM